MTYKGRTAEGNHDICELFKEKIMSKFTVGATTEQMIHNSLLYVQNGAMSFHVNDIHLTTETVIAAIADIKSSFIPWPDGIPPIVIKNCSNVLVGPLLSIL